MLKLRYALSTCAQHPQLKREDEAQRELALLANQIRLNEKTWSKVQGEGEERSREFQTLKRATRKTKVAPIACLLVKVFKVSRRLALAPGCSSILMT